MKVDKRLDKTDQQLTSLRAEVDNGFVAIAKEFTRIDERFATIAYRLDQHDERFDQFEKRMDQRFDQMVSHIDHLANSQDTQDTEAAMATNRLRRHEQWIEKAAVAIDIPYQPVA